MAVIETTFETLVDVPTPTQLEFLKRAEQIKDFPDEFIEVDPGDFKKTSKMVFKVGKFSRITIFARASFAALTWYLVWEYVKLSTETLTEPIHRKKRRKKTELCLLKCLTFIDDAKKDLDYMTNRSLRYDNSPARHRRKAATRKNKKSKSQ
jgi:hypothetical protein